MSDRQYCRPIAWTHHGKSATISRICGRIANGESLRAICADPWMPNRGTVLEWVRTDPGSARQYSRAMDVRADLRSERIDAYTSALLAGQMTPAAARVAIDAEKWLASKESPRRYGRQAPVEPVLCERLTDDELAAQINRLVSRVGPNAAVSQPVRTGARARVMG